MPTTVSGLTFYEEQFETGLYQGLTQAVNAFNGASGGAMILTSGAAKGRLPVETFFQAQAGLVQARNPSGTSNLTPTKFQNAEHGSVKVFDSAPMVFSAQDWEDSGLSQEVSSYLFGVNYGENMAIRMVNSGIAALVGALLELGAVATHDVSATGAFDYGVLSRGLGKFGDRRQALRTLVAHSIPLTDLAGQAFTSQQVAFQLGTTTIYNGGMPSLGLGVVNTDSASLLIDNSNVDFYRTLALVPGALMIKTGPSRQVFSFVPGTAAATPENQTWLLSVESSFEIKVKGVSFGGSALPNDAALALAANWDDVTSAAGGDVKNGPGVMIISQ